MKRKANKVKKAKKPKKLTTAQSVAAIIVKLEEFLGRLEAVEAKLRIPGPKGDKGEPGKRGRGFWGTDG